MEEGCSNEGEVDVSCQRRRRLGRVTLHFLALLLGVGRGLLDASAYRARVGEPEWSGVSACGPIAERYIAVEWVIGRWALGVGHSAMDDKG